MLSVDFQEARQEATLEAEEEVVEELGAVEAKALEEHREQLCHWL